MGNIIGREKEIIQLDNIKDREESAFIAVYGRRRIGKTFLIREYYKYMFDFQLTGLANGNTKEQLMNFHLSLKRQHDNNNNSPKNWITAFERLKTNIEKIEKTHKKIIFIDEMPWLDTPRSDFMMALEHFWNSWASSRKDIILITCGSAAAWMINKLINNHGGLHNRVTDRIKLEPFTLSETAQLLATNNIQLDKYQILQLYMVMGGIPFYLKAVKPGLSAAQNIEELCFRKGGLLVSEFSNLFKSLFRNADKHERIIIALASKTKGLTRTEIVKFTKIPSGGGITKVLDELEESGFITSYVPFMRKKRNGLYRLSDFYSFFFLKFIKDNKDYSIGKWIYAIDHPSQRAWAGYAFEQICLAHVPQIKKALGINGIISNVSSWKSASTANGAQIDLVIDRRDHVVNLCEMKYSISTFSITKSYDINLRNKIEAFRTETKTKKALFLSMITTYGIAQNKYAHSIVQNDIKMDALFTD